MGTLLMGHGTFKSEEVKVPDGMTISFLIDEGRTMPFPNGVNAVRMTPATMLDEGFKMSSQHFGGEWISNHELTVLSSDQRAWYAQVDPEDGTCFYAGEHFGSPILLCSQPGRDGACAAGEHSCDGLFGMEWRDTDLYWVSCRGGAYQNTQQGIGPADVKNTPSGFVADVQAATKLLTRDPGEFEKYFFTTLTSDDDRAPYLASTSIRMWVRQRQARQWLADGTSDRDFYAFIRGHEIKEQGEYLNGIPELNLAAPVDLNQAYQRGEPLYFIEEAKAYLDRQGPENFRFWAYGLDANARAIMARDAGLAAALQVTDPPASAKAQEAKFGMSVEEIDWAVVQAMNEDVLKAVDEGSSVPYWQRPSGELLIGRDQPKTYRQLIELERAPGTDPTGTNPTGRITVVSKGGRLTAGTLMVSGPCNRDVAKQWIGAFSRKTVKFG